MIRKSFPLSPKRDDLRDAGGIQTIFSASECRENEEGINNKQQQSFEKASGDKRRRHYSPFCDELLYFGQQEWERVSQFRHVTRPNPQMGAVVRD